MATDAAMRSILRPISSMRATHTSQEFRTFGFPTIGTWRTHVTTVVSPSKGIASQRSRPSFQEGGSESRFLPGDRAPPFRLGRLPLRPGSLDRKKTAYVSIGDRQRTVWTVSGAAGGHVSVTTRMDVARASVLSGRRTTTRPRQALRAHSAKANRAGRGREEAPMKPLAAANALGYAGLIAVNALSIYGRLGPSNADVSAKFQTLITPTGSTFMIWGVIFALQLVSVVMQVLPIGKTKMRDETVNAIGFYWILGWTSQCAWQFAFVREAKVLCAFLLVGAFLSFTTASVRLLKLEEKRRKQRPVSTAQESSSATDPAKKETQDEGEREASGEGETKGKRSVAGPCKCDLSSCTDQFFRRVHTAGTVMNAAWLAAATTIGVLIVPVAYNVKVSELASALALLPALGIGLFFSFKLLSVVYPLTLFWALWGISAQSPSHVVVQAANAGSVIMVLSAAVAALRRKYITRQPSYSTEAKPLLS